MDDRIANVTLDSAPICHDEAAPALDVDADGLEDRSRDPGQLTPGIDERVESLQCQMARLADVVSF